MTPFDPGRLTRFARGLQGSEGPLGVAMVLVAFGLVAMMLIRVAIAWLGTGS